MTTEVASFSTPKVLTTLAQDGTYIEVEGMSWPNGPMLRVRDIKREEMVQGGTAEQRAVVLEIFLKNDGWTELVRRNYLGTKSTNGLNVVTLGSGFGRRRDKFAELVQQGQMRASDMIEQSFGW